MSLPETIQRIYHELSIRYDRQREEGLRDVFLLLAADVAFASGRGDEAERLHHEMIQANPNSIVRPFPSFAAALQSLDIQDYLADLRRQFPPEEAEKLLLKVRANPLGRPADSKKTLSQRDTQEVIAPTARTVNMPAPTNLPPRKKSPYEQQYVPLPPALDESPWNARLTFVWLVLLSAAGFGLAFWSLVRPLWQ
ncbi:MAG: hypothetical protein WCL32_03245 [Planctomycetota bacterium]